MLLVLNEIYINELVLKRRIRFRFKNKNRLRNKGTTENGLLKLKDLKDFNEISHRHS